MSNSFLYYDLIMKNYKTRGYINGILAAVSYGTNPLFALPMYKLGMSVNSVLFYRYLFAVIIYGVSVKLFKKVNLKLSLKEFVTIFPLAMLFALSSVTMFEALKYLDSGVACTILFVYPIIVALISTIFYKEKLTKTSIFAMFLALSGIFMLNGGISGHLNPLGVFFILSSALVYAIYMVLVKNLKTIKHMKYEKLTFYVMLFGLSVFVYNLKFCTELQPITDWRVFACATALAIFPTIISIETINVAIRLIGSTTTAILGALDPLTAIFFGVVVFGEALTVNRVMGIILVLLGAMLIIIRDKWSVRDSNS